MAAAALPTIDGVTELEEIGRGGAGVVYRGWEAAHGRHVAVKLLVGAAHDDRGLHRFERERQALGRVSGHPGIVAVYRSDVTESGVPYLIMPFIEGGALDELDTPFDAAEVAAVGNAVADALAAAHSVSVLHLDLKPSNVLKDAYGNYLLTDFGIARIFESADQHVSQTVAFTPAYASPEIIQGRAPTEATDVYGLAATLYGLVAGSAPHERRQDEDTLAFYQRVVEGPIPPLAPALPASLRTAIESAMVTDPAARPPLAAVRDLCQLAQQEPLDPGGPETIASPSAVPPAVLGAVGLSAGTTNVGAPPGPNPSAPPTPPNPPAEVPLAAPPSEAAPVAVPPTPGPGPTTAVGAPDPFSSGANALAPNVALTTARTEKNGRSRAVLVGATTAIGAMALGAGTVLAINAFNDESPPTTAVEPGDEQTALATDDGDDEAEGDGAEPTSTAPPTTQPADDEESTSQPPTTQAPTTQPPTTRPPTTQPPTTRPPTTQPPTTLPSDGELIDLFFSEYEFVDSVILASAWGVNCCPDAKIRGGELVYRNQRSTIAATINGISANEGIGGPARTEFINSTYSFDDAAAVAAGIGSNLPWVGKLHIGNSLLLNRPQDFTFYLDGN